MLILPMPETIRTERLLIQRLRYEDAEEIFYTYASRDEATRFVAWPTHQNVDDTREFLRYARQAWAFGSDYSYSVRLHNNRLVGSVGATNENGKVQVGYIFGPLHWGQGYATEACRALLVEVSKMKQVYRIGSFVDVENKASIRVLEKCGMVEEARLPEWFRFVNQGDRPKECALFRYIWGE
jgi:ribosomal-protein-alanine N-acetyltransferase